MTRSYESFVSFLYDSPIDSAEFCYYHGRRLVGCSLTDRYAGGADRPGWLSSVYMYFDPDWARQSLGSFSVLWETLHAQQQGWRYYYLGYYVADSPTMSYKARFRPNERLIDDQVWVLFRE